MMDRFWSKVDRSGDCWTWTGAKDFRGYGRFRMPNGKTAYPHRLSCEWAYGDVPEGWVVDHLCENPSCVNPDHLEAVTRAENTRRSRSGKSFRGMVSTACKNGHEKDAKNTYLHRGRQCCKTCRVEATRQWRLRRKSKES